MAKVAMAEAPFVSRGYVHSIAMPTSEVVVGKDMQKFGCIRAVDESSMVGSRYETGAKRKVNTQSYACVHKFHPP